MNINDTLFTEDQISPFDPSITPTSIHSSYRGYTLHQMQMILKKLNLTEVVRNYQRSNPLNLANAFIEMDNNESIACQYVNKMALNIAKPLNKDLQKNVNELELAVSYTEILEGKLDRSVDMVLNKAEKLNEALTAQELVTTKVSSAIPLEENESELEFYDTSAIKASLDNCNVLCVKSNKLQQELDLLKEKLQPLQILPCNLNEIKIKMDEANKTIDDLKNQMYKHY